MDIETAKKQLDEIERHLYAYKHAVNTIINDSETAAPAESQECRGVCLEYLAEEEFQLKTSKATSDIVEYIYQHKEEAGPEYWRRSEILHSSIHELNSISSEEYTDYITLTNDAGYAWLKAKKNSDWKSFEPYCRKVVDSLAHQASLMYPDKDVYDVLLNQNEEGSDRAYYDRFFEELKKTLVPLIAKIRECPQPDDSWLHVSYPIEQQKKLSKLLMDTFLIDGDHCTIAETEHPYTSNCSSQDVRITTHYHENDPVSSMFSVIHEGGHANYELHVNPVYDYNCLSGGCSMALHESQSRFWENYVGRSREFAIWFWPRFSELFPVQTKGHTAEEFYRCINISKPSLIRIDADELTYSMHILIRYEIEKKLFSEKLTVDQLPSEWNRLYKEYLGVDVPDDAHGVLQDVHWSQGSFGYFPTYSLGTAYSAQILDKMKSELDFAGLVEAGNMAPIMDWLSERIYRYGCLNKPGTYVPAITGKPFSASYYCDYLTGKFSELYDL